MDHLSTSFDEAWARFQALDTLRVAPDTLEGEWARGRTDYLAFLAPIEDAAARAHISRLLDRLCGIAGVEPYAESYWHITVKGVGFRVPQPVQADEISPKAAGAIADAARGILARESAFEARAGRVNAFEGVVFVEVEDGGQLAVLNTLLMQRIPDVGRYQYDAPNFLPHISIARFTSGSGLAQVKPALAALREDGAGPSFPVRRVDFVSARLSAGAPAFDLVTSCPLRGGSRR